jgi:dihydroorotase-like cyclic amidohydrolase
MEGELTLNQEFKLKRRDAARITDLNHLQIKADQDASFMLIDLP